MRFWLLNLVIFLSFTMLIIGCGGEEPVEDTANLAAKVEDWSVTKSEIEETISKLPSGQKEKYQSLGGKATLANQLLEEELFHREGMRLNIENDEDTKELIESMKRKIIISEYYKKYIQEEAHPTEEEMLNYYEENTDQFIVQEIARAYHIFAKDEEKIFRLKKQLDEGARFMKLASQVSEDLITREDGGDLGFFNPGGYIRFVGYSKTFSDAVFALEQGVVSDPIKWERGWSIVKVTEKRPERLKSFEEAQNEINRILTKSKVVTVRDEVAAKLKERYDHYNFYEEELKITERSPEELWNFAQTTSNSYQRLNTYQEIVNKFPDSEYAPQALFMVGFVSAEELKDLLQANNAFRQVIEKYPGSNVAKSAEWMLENLNKPLPEFKDLNELHEKISDESKTE